MQEQPANDDYMRDTFYTELMFGSQNQSPRPRVPNSKFDLKWGSDSGFGAPQGFTPPIHQEKVASVERYHMKAVSGAFLETANQAHSTDTTRPSSPILTHSTTPHQRTRCTARANDDDEDSRPRKRRKGKLQEDADDDKESAAEAMSQAGINKRKPSKKATSAPIPSEQSHKRGKSTAVANAAAKTARENLTEDHKREKHIKSEQKRRTLIREGFEDLGELVPGLQGGGFSKSAVLGMAADWLEDLIQGNDVLRRQLDVLQGRG